jgi:ankyrin repeat protein
MPQKNPWGTVVKVEHEKVEDASPDVWLQAACKSIDSGDYNKALEQIAKGRQLDVGGQYLFLFDLLDIINYYNLSMPEKAHRIKNKYSDQDFISFIYNDSGYDIIESFHDLWKIDSKSWTDIWYGCLDYLLSRNDFSAILQYKKDIDNYWFIYHINDHHIEIILKNNNLDMIKYLSECAYPFYRCKFDNGLNITMEAIKVSNIEVIRYIMGLHCNSIKDTSYSGDTALFYAIDRGEIDAVLSLINDGADVNWRNSERETPLIRACKGGAFFCDFTEKVIDALVKSGSNIHVFDNQHRNIIQCLITQKHVIAAPALNTAYLNLINKLLRYGVDITTVDTSGHDALYDAAIEVKNTSILNILINSGANPDRRYQDGKTLLHIIAQGNHWDNSMKEVWRDLMGRANVNIRDNNGYTPLMYSVNHNWTFSDELDMARQLVKHGARTDIVGQDGRTVKNIMRSHNIDPRKLYNNESSNFFSKLFS